MDKETKNKMIQKARGILNAPKKGFKTPPADFPRIAYMKYLRSCKNEDN